MNDRRAGLAGGAAVPTLQESKTSEAEHFSGVRPGVTMLVMPRGPEQQDLIYVYSGSVDLFRSACYWRPASWARDVSAVCTIKEAKLKPSALGVGRNPFEVRDRSGKRTASLSRDLGCGVRRREGFPPTATLHAHKLRGKDVGGELTSAATLRCATPKKTSPATTPVAQTVSGPPVREAGSRTAGACHSEPRL